MMPHADERYDSPHIYDDWGEEANERHLEKQEDWKRKPAPPSSSGREAYSDVYLPPTEHYYYEPPLYQTPPPPPTSQYHHQYPTHPASAYQRQPPPPPEYHAAYAPHSGYADWESWHGSAAPVTPARSYSHYHYPNMPPPPPPSSHSSYHQPGPEVTPYASHYGDRSAFYNYSPPPPPRDSTSPTKRAARNDKYIYDVTDFDVLCGRGAPTNFHPGNQYFRQLVSKKQSSYLAAKRADKPEIALDIVKHMTQRGGRFLKRVKVPGTGTAGHFGWQEIGEQRAYEKACQALREGAPEIRKSLAAKEYAAAGMSDGTASR